LGGFDSYRFRQFKGEKHMINSKTDQENHVAVYGLAAVQ